MEIKATLKRNRKIAIVYGTFGLFFSTIGLAFLIFPSQNLSYDKIGSLVFGLGIVFFVLTMFIILLNAVMIEQNKEDKK